MNILSRRRTAPIRAVCAAAAALVAAASLAACVDAEGSADEQNSLFVATGGATANQMVPYLAEVLGYADDEGLDLTVQTLEGNTVAAVVSGRADVAQFGAGSALAPIGEGKDTALILGLQAGKATGFVVAGDGIDDLSQCQRVSTHPRGSSAFSSAAAYKKATDATFEIIEFTTPTDVVASVLSGQSDCASSSLGVLSPGIEQGLHIILDPRVESEIPPDSVQGTTGVSFWAMKDVLARKSGAVDKMVGATAKVEAYLETATPDEVAAALMQHPDFAANDSATLTANAEAEMPFLFPDGGRITAENWPATLEYYQVGNPAIVPGQEIWSYDERVDMSFLDTATGV